MTMLAEVAYALLAVGLAVVAAADHPVRAMIGVELAILGAVLGALAYSDLDVLAVLVLAAVADTLLMAAAIYRLSKLGAL